MSNENTNNKVKVDITDDLEIIISKNKAYIKADKSYKKIVINVFKDFKENPSLDKF